MSLVELAKASWLRQMEDIAHDIEREMKAEAGRHRPTYRSPTGEAADSIKTEKVNDIIYRIGAYADFDSTGDGNGGTHLYYMNYGNSSNGADGRIHPTRGKGLKLKDGSVRRSVSTYGGRHFIERIASKYR